MLKLREKTNGDHPIKCSSREFNGAKKFTLLNTSKAGPLTAEFNGVKNKKLFNFTQKIVFVCLLVFVFGLNFTAKASAATYYVSQIGAGTKNGTSVDNAWQELSGVDWDTDGDGPDEGVGGGDTLYIVGTIRATTFSINGYGLSENQRMTIASYPEDPGKIWQGLEIAGTGWSGPDEFGAYSKSVTCSNYNVASEWISDPWSESIRLTTMNGIPDSSWNDSSGLYYYDNVNGIVYYKPTSGSPEGKTLTAWASTSRVFNVTDKDYITISGLTMNNEIKFYNSVDYLILENNEISCSGTQNGITIGNYPGFAPSNHGIFRGNYIHDCGNGIYFVNQGYGNEYNNNYWTVEDNYIENIHGTNDAHGIGVQGGTGNIFQRNHIYNTGSGITFWNDTDQIMRDNVVRFNKIDHVGYYYESDNANGRGIEFSGETADSNLTTGNLIYSNVVSDCYRDSDGDPDGIGIRIKNGILESGGYSIKVFNNTVSDCYYNYYLLPSNNENYEIGSYFRNNISLNPKTGGYHVFVSAIGNIFDLDFDRNVYYPEGKFNYDGNDCADFTQWKEISGEDSNSYITNPNLTSSLIPQDYGSGLDGGEDMSFLASNFSLGSATIWPTGVASENNIINPPIYGLPDIGAYEYQPPYDMGTDEVDISADVRVYGDGKFRNTKTTSGTTADLSIVPASDDTSQYLDIDISTWDTSSTYEKEWTETSDTITGNTLHTIGDLEEGKYYNITVDSATTGLSSANCDLVDSNFVCQADENGQISFTWTGGYSTHTFNVTEGDNIDSTVTNTTSAKFHTDTTSVTLSLITDEDSTCKYSTENTTYDNMTMFTTTGETSHSTEVTDLSPGNYTYYAICRDGVGNDTSHTLSFEIAEKEDETDINDAKLKENNNSQKLNDDKKISYNQKETKIKGEDHAVANGTVKIYKEGKRIATVDVDGDGKWSKKIKFGHNKTYTLKIKFYDEYGTLRNTKKYDVKIDTEKPIFSDPFSISKSIARDEKITFTATDKDSGMDFYKVKLLDKNGHITRSWRKQDEDWYKIPGAVENGTYILLVRAYDKAGNYAKEQVVLSVGQETGGESGLSAQSANTNSGQSIEVSANTCSYTVQSGDTLWSIAKQVYGDATQYQKIINLNPDLNSDALKIGQELKLCEEGEDVKGGKTQNE